MKKLILYVNGMGPRSVAAAGNLKSACERHAPGEYEIEVIDVRTRPEVARELNLIALPSLLGDLPPPLRKVVGDLANLEEVIGVLRRSQGTT